ncbi:FtsX-like permease family protein [Heliobacterium gestii]|uniref:FtsX-like permease family protein n=1 Tax=Heliomicrobium gestii TaxID=2699 RepID=A0A845LA81_HELGE|nr:ABC transporter permease [Heliomicrobium gestii]MBM7865590.1 putative ABC transport system permease protein [Heliomicrobium gestii]MZP41840.1 FtsX-like permease family protein [Heliomicrobium gestii]
MIRIVWQSLRRRRVQSVAALTGIAVGVAILTAVYLLYQGLEEGVRVGANRVGADLLVIPAEVNVEPGQALFTGAPLNIYMPKQYAQEVERLPGVRQVEGRFFTQTLNESCCTLQEELRLIGVDPQIGGTLASLAPALQGKELNPDEILVGSQIVGGIPGNRIFVHGELFRIAAVLDATGTGLDKSILMPGDTARRLAKGSKELQGFWQKAGPPEDLLSELLVHVNDPREGKAVADAIGRLGPLRVLQTNEMFQQTKQQMHLIFTLLTGAGLLAVAASAIQLAARFAGATWERKGEWGLYRALGASRRQLLQLVLAEALLLSVGGAAIGLLLGGLLYSETLSLIRSYHAIPFLVPTWDRLAITAGAAISLFTGIGLAAAGITAHRVANIPPWLAMVRGDVD